MKISDIERIINKYRFAEDRPVSLPTTGKKISVEWDDMLSLIAEIDKLKTQFDDIQHLSLQGFVDWKQELMLARAAEFLVENDEEY